MSLSKSRLLVSVSILGFGMVLAAPNAMAASDMSNWASTIAFSGHLDAGITANFDQQTGRDNWGNLFGDKANQLLLNQLALTAQRPIDSSKDGYDVGFKLQGIYGSDARYTHFLGELDKAITDRNQVDIVEANVQFHTPWLTKGGIDFKVGQYSTPMGLEVIDPTGNFFYSHSYIFNFGIPLKHTGALATAHVTPMVDLYGGIDTGVNTSFGQYGDNNENLSYIAGVGLNLMGGNLTVLALTHIGPELPKNNTSGLDGSQPRSLSDIAITYKVNDKLTSMTELNYIRDDGVKAGGGGVAQYFTYAINDWLSAGIRGEIWRDATGFYVAAFPGNQDFILAEKGQTNGSVASPGDATYGALTVGLNIKPPKVPKYFEGLTVRPELRVDTAFAGKPFNPDSNGNDRARTSFTPAVDVVVPF